MSGLVNGTRYEFRVLAVNAVGVSEPPLSQVFETPATVPDAVPALEVVAGNESMSLTWTAPASDGESPITDYAIQFRAAGQPWTDFDHPPTTDLDHRRDRPGERDAVRLPRGRGQPHGPGRLVPARPRHARRAARCRWSIRSRSAR